MKYACLAVIAGLVVSCTPYQQQADVIGAVGGAAAGTAHEGNQQLRDYERYGIPAPDGTQAGQPQPSNGGGTKKKSSDYPVAQRTETQDEVLSPYPPHHRINVGGFQPGQLARDPKNNKIFRVP